MAVSNGLGENHDIVSHLMPPLGKFLDGGDKCTFRYSVFKVRLIFAEATLLD